MKEAKKPFFTVREMVFTALFAALICMAAPISVPLPGMVPISLATFVIYIAAPLLGGKRGTAAVLVYILIGMVGLPVFSGMRGGIAVLLGTTGGYIVGYIPMALVMGVFSDIKSKLNWTIPVGMVLGTVALYTFGTAWFMFMTKSPLATALASCVLPFIAFDGMKMVLATVITVPLKSRLNKIMGVKAE